MSSLTRGTRGLIFGVLVVLAGVTLLLDQMNLTAYSGSGH
jgi:hypothetical protein